MHKKENLKLTYGNK